MTHESCCCPSLRLRLVNDSNLSKEKFESSAWTMGHELANPDAQLTTDKRERERVHFLLWASLLEYPNTAGGSGDIVLFLSRLDFKKIEKICWFLKREVRNRPIPSREFKHSTEWMEWLTLLLLLLLFFFEHLPFIFIFKKKTQGGSCCLHAKTIYWNFYCLFFYSIRFC